MAMLCPRCGDKLSCQDSRPQPVGTVKRSYRCLKCGARVYTVEVMIKFKEAKGRDQQTEAGARARGKAKLAAEILQSQGIEI